MNENIYYVIANNVKLMKMIIQRKRIERDKTAGMGQRVEDFCWREYVANGRIADDKYLVVELEWRVQRVRVNHVAQENEKCGDE